MPDTYEQLPQIILTIVIVGCILFIGTFALNETAATQDTTARVNDAATLNGLETVKIADNIGKNEQVVNSRGYAINLSGASNSYFETQQPVEFAQDDTFSASVWARADSASATATMGVLTTSELVIWYNGTQGQWSAWHYDSGARTSYRVNVSAPNQPSNLTNIQVVKNSTTIAIFRDNTLGESQSLSSSSTATAPTGVSNWDGRIDELRTFDDPLDASDRAALISNPVDPLKRNRTARIMFDEPGEDVQLLFFAPGGVATSNAAYSDGLDGAVMDGKSFANDLTGETDYQWNTDGPRIKPTAGGDLDGAPVAYVTYDQIGHLTTLTDDWTQAMGLVAVLIVLLPLGVIVMLLQNVNNRR